MGARQFKAKGLQNRVYVLAPKQEIRDPGKG